MTIWEQFGVEVMVVEALREYDPFNEPINHFGRVFMPIYELAMRIDRMCPELTEQFAGGIGGEGSGGYSLAGYLAWMISRKIKSREITNVEGAWVPITHSITWRHGGMKITSTSDRLSMFRLKDAN